MDADKKMKDDFVDKSEQDYARLLRQYEEENARYEEEKRMLERSHEDKIKYEEQRNREIEEEIERIKE